MKFPSCAFLSKENRPTLLKLPTYCRSSASKNALMMSRRLRTRKEVPPVRKVKDEEEMEMIRAKLAKKLRFNFGITPNMCTGVVRHSKKLSEVHSIQDKLCKRQTREDDRPVTSTYMTWDPSPLQMEPETSDSKVHNEHRMKDV